MTFDSYKPGGTEGKNSWQASLVACCRLSFVFDSTSSTLAPGITAPERSLTVRETTAVVAVWAGASLDNTSAPAEGHE
ncbi:MAG: hypothetical protein RMI94_08595 [Bryobacterales bacterium]|nr:hypothetical protein [Bryobacteraceae bacterium]MDW8130594.1 hypothetical protein [Bryobacterales bacterium]